MEKDAIMTRKVTLKMAEALKWQLDGRHDDFSFTMSMIHWLIEQGFLANPDPECPEFKVYSTGDEIVFEKVLCE